MDAKTYSVVERLKDGREVLIRAVRPSDKDKVRGILSVLSKETIYRRFFTLKKTLSEKELSDFTDVDFVTSVQLVAELTEENDKIIGGCRYVVFDTNTVPERAEIAFMVLDDFQGKGLGKMLFRHLADIGRTNGLKRFDAVVLAINQGMMRIFTGSGLKVSQSREGSEVCFDIDLLTDL